MPSQSKQLTIYPNDELLEWIDSLPGPSRNSKVTAILAFARASVKSVPGLQEAFELLLRPSVSQVDTVPTANEPKPAISPATSSLLSSILEETTASDIAAKIHDPTTSRPISERTTSNEFGSHSLPTGHADSLPPHSPEQQETRLSKLEREVQSLKAKIDVLSKEVHSRKKGSTG